MKLQLPNLQHAGLFPLGFAQQHPQTGQQLLKGKGLDEVVVSTCIQASHPVLDAVPGGEQQHGHLISLPTQAGEHPQAVELGHHDVQHQGIILRTQEVIEDLLPVKAAVHTVTGFLQPLF